MNLPFVASPDDFPYEALNSKNDKVDFENPNLFQEVFSMAYASASIFALSDVREAARTGVIDVPNEVISLPVTIDVIEKAFRNNEEILKSYLKPADFAIMESLSHDTSNDRLEEEKEIHRPEQSSESSTINMLRHCTLHYFGDDNADIDCVYAIIKNPINKRIILCFRGSITYQDWIKDSKVFVGDIPNPLSDVPDQPETIGVHLGFKEYLYGCAPKKVRISQLDAIRSSFSSVNSGNLSYPSSNYVNAVVAATGVNMNETTKTNLHRMGLNLSMAVSKWKGKTGINGSQDSTHSLDDLGTCNQLGGETKGNGNCNYIESKSDNDDNNNNDNNVDNTRCDDDNNSNYNSSNNDNIDINYADDNDYNNYDEDKNDHHENDVSNEEKESTTENAGSRCRLDKILEEIEDLQQDCSDYRLYVTGHSLGGALGLLTALEAGTRFGTLDLPVTYVGIANPRGGTETFRDAISVLEKEGKLRCICVHGRLDLVPMIPASPPNRPANKRFCQSGIELVFEPDKFVMRYSPRADDNYIQRVGLVLKRVHKISDRHHYMSYLKELGKFAEPLRELYLNDYYNTIFDCEMFPCSDKKLTPMVVKLNQEGNDCSYKFIMDVDQQKENEENDTIS